jgi:hypothetical protein
MSMMDKCGCNNLIQGEIEIPISSCSSNLINNNQEVILEDVRSEICDLCELKKKIICDFYSIKNKLECGV